MPEQWNKYGPTAARKHGKPGREVRPKSVTIDIHAHVDVPAAAKFVAPHLDMTTVPLAHFATPESKALTQKQAADISARRDHSYRCLLYTSLSVQAGEPLLRGGVGCRRMTFMTANWPLGPGSFFEHDCRVHSCRVQGGSFARS